MLDCPLCDAAVEGYSTSAFSQDDESALEELQEAEIPPRRQRRAGRIWMNRAAAVLLIIVGAYAIWQYRSETRHQALFAEFYTPLPPAYLSLRSAAATDPLEGQPELRAALEWYEEGGYEESAIFLERHLNQHPRDEQAQLLLASALLGNWRGERAVDILHQLENTSTETEDLYWYLALGHVQNNQLDSARILLSQSQFSGERADKAAALEAALQP